MPIILGLANELEALWWWTLPVVSPPVGAWCRTAVQLCLFSAAVTSNVWMSCVFDGAAPNLQEALQTKDDFLLWEISSAKGLSTLSLEGFVAAG